MKNKKYVVFLDIDGTLITQGIMPEENVYAIQKAQSLGHKVFLNTGRSYGNIPKFVLDTIDYDGIVAGIGAYIQVGDELLKNETLSEDWVTKIIAYFLPTGRPCILEGDREIFYLNIDKINTNEDGKNVITSSKDFSTIYKNKHLTKGTFFGILEAEDLTLLQPEFNVVQHEHYAEFGLKDCSKSKGMRIAMGHLGIPMENSVAIGDSANDMDMLKSAGTSIAMGNAIEQVKSVCDFVTDTAENAGVAMALEKVVKGFTY